jgi:drug/metabolite transporter (DMT)-like permease
MHLSGGFGLGVGLLVLASAIWSLYGLSQKVLQRHLGSQHILMLVYFGAIVVLLPLVSPGEVRNLSSLQLALLTFCGLNTLFAYGAFAESLKHWEVSRVGATIAATPLFTLAFTWIASRIAPAFVQPEQLNSLSVLGALLVASGSALCALGGGAGREAVHPGAEA